MPPLASTSRQTPDERAGDAIEWSGVFSPSSRDLHRLQRRTMPREGLRPSRSRLDQLLAGFDPEFRAAPLDVAGADARAVSPDDRPRLQHRTVHILWRGLEATGVAVRTDFGTDHRWQEKSQPLLPHAPASRVGCARRRVAGATASRTRGQRRTTARDSGPSHRTRDLRSREHNARLACREAGRAEIRCRRQSRRRSPPT